MDPEIISHILDGLSNQNVMELAATNTISQIRIVGITASSRRDPARNMRLSTNIMRNNPISVKLTPRIRELKQSREFSNLFREAPDLDNSSTIACSLLLPDKIAFGDIKYCEDTESSYNEDLILPIEDRQALEHICSDLVIQRRQNPLQLHRIPRREKKVDTRVPVTSLLKAIVAPDYSAVTEEESKVLTILRPHLTNTPLKNLEKLAHDVSEMIMPSMKTVFTTQNLGTKLIKLQLLSQFPDLEICIPGRGVERGIHPLIDSCTLMIKKTMTETSTRTMRKVRLRENLDTHKLGNESLTKIIMKTQHKSVAIQFCQLSLNMNLASEVETRVFTMKVIRTGLLEHREVVIPTMAGTPVIVDYWKGDEDIAFKWNRNQNIHGIFKRRLSNPSFIMDNYFSKISDQTRMDFLSDFLWFFKLFETGIEQPVVPMPTGISDLKRRIKANDLNKFIIDKFQPNLVCNNRLNYDGHFVKLYPQMCDDLTVVNRLKQGHQTHLSMYTTTQFMEQDIKKPMNLSEVKGQHTVEETLIQIWETLFSTEELFEKFIISFKKEIEKQPPLIRYDLICKKIKRTFVSNQQQAAYDLLKYSYEDWDQRLQLYILFIILKSGINPGIQKELVGQDELSSLRVGGYTLDPLIPNKDFHESGQFIFILGKPYLKQKNVLECLKRKYHCVVQESFDSNKRLCTVSQLLSQDLQESLVMTPQGICKAVKRKYDIASKDWISESHDSRVITSKRPRLEDQEAGPSGMQESTLEEGYNYEHDMFDSEEEEDDGLIIDESSF